MKPECPNCGSHDISIRNVVENTEDGIIEDYDFDICWKCGYPDSFGND